MAHFYTSVSRHCYCPLERASGGLEDTERRPGTCDPPFTAQGWPKKLPREGEISPGSRCLRVLAPAGLCPPHRRGHSPPWLWKPAGDKDSRGRCTSRDARSPRPPPWERVQSHRDSPGLGAEAEGGRAQATGQADTRCGPVWSPPAEGCSVAGGPGPACHLQTSPPPRASSTRASQSEPWPLSPTPSRLGLPAAPTSLPGAAPPPVFPARTC